MLSQQNIVSNHHAMVVRLRSALSTAPGRYDTARKTVIWPRFIDKECDTTTRAIAGRGSRGASS